MREVGKQWTANVTFCNVVKSVDALSDDGRVGRVVRRKRTCMYEPDHHERSKRSHTVVFSFYKEALLGRQSLDAGD